MQKRRSIIILLMAVASVVCAVCVLLMLGYRREQANRALILAIEANDTKRALAALQDHADPNVREQSDVGLSLRVYLSKLWQQMHGIKPTEHQTGSTALTLTVCQNNTVLAEALLARGARDVEKCLIDAGDEGNLSLSVPLLVIATRNKNTNIIRSLVNYGSDVNAVDDNGETALFHAEDPITAETLLWCGAQIAATNKNGYTALDSHLNGELASSNASVAQVLLDHGANDARALPLAARSAEDTDVLKRLLGNSWQVDMRDQEGSTPLMLALGAMTHEQLTHALLWTLADKPIAKSVREKQRRVVLLLLRSGANVNLQDRKGNTPLLLAAEGGRYSMSDPDEQWASVIRALLERGARINAQNKDGMTPLMVAASYLRPDLVHLLLVYGAGVKIRTGQGQTALSMAQAAYSSSEAIRSHNRSQIIRMLKAAGASE